MREETESHVRGREKRQEKSWLCSMGRAAPVPETCIANLGGIWESTVANQSLSRCSKQTRPMKLGDFPFQGLTMIRI